MLFAAFLFFTLLGVIHLLQLRFLNRDWWQLRLIKILGFALPMVGIGATIALWVGFVYSISWLKQPAMILIGVSFIFELLIVMSLPVASLIRLIGGLLIKLIPTRDRVAATKETELVDPSRRKALGLITASVPLGAMALGVSGFGSTLAGGANVYERKISLAALPEKLKGFKILHLSDLHLGSFISLDDLEAVLTEAHKFNPDFVLMTGDIADDLALLPEALKLVDQLGAPMGTYASLGNHEHYRGVTEVRRKFDASPVNLIVDSGLPLYHRGERLFLAAIDDPKGMRGEHSEFYRRRLDLATRDSISEDFRLLMSHRPSVFDSVPAYGIDLTLAGHTHGGQLGFMGSSLFESVATQGYLPEKYLWGEYTKEQSRLYTSSGVGHWFPFRLGCPPEAPIIILS